MCACILTLRCILAPQAAVQGPITSPKVFYNPGDIIDFLHEASDGFSHAVTFADGRDYVAKAILECQEWPRWQWVLADFYALFSTPPINAVTIYYMYCTYMELAGLGGVFRGSMAIRRLARRALYFRGFERLQWKTDELARLTADWDTGGMIWEGCSKRRNRLLGIAARILPSRPD